MESTRKLFELLVLQTEEINALVKEFFEVPEPLTKQITVEVKFTNGNLCFLNIVSWLYVYFVDEGGSKVTFLRKKLQSSHLAVSNDVENILSYIQAFRTVQQHNLDLEYSKPDQDKKNLCDSFFLECIEKDAPIDEEEWFACTEVLLNKSIYLCTGIKNYLIDLRDSEFKGLVSDEWRMVISHNYSSYDFEQVLIKVLANFGMTDLFDTNQVAKAYKDRWRSKLEFAPELFDFERVASIIIEKTVLSQELLPINGNDIISLGVPPGRKVPELLMKAKEIFYANPCKKEELLNSIVKFT